VTASDVNIYTLDMSRRQAVAGTALYAVALVTSIVVAIGTDQPGLWGLVPIVVYAGLALVGVDIVGADIVEVSPPYDGRGEQTAYLANRVVLEVLNGIAERT